MRNLSIILAAKAMLAATRDGIKTFVTREAKKASPVEVGPAGTSQNGPGGGGNRAYQRAALKKRNRAAHRRACRGGFTPYFIIFVSALSLGFCLGGLVVSMACQYGGF